MLAFAGRIGDFVNRHPSMKILALSFLLLIGVMLIADGMGQHIGKGYIYFGLFRRICGRACNEHRCRRQIARFQQPPQGMLTPRETRVVRP